MVEMAERGPIVPFWQKRVIPEGHPYTFRNICAITGLTPDDIKCVVSPRNNRGQEPLVQPTKLQLNHIRTNMYSPQDLEVFSRIQELKKSGLTIGKAIDTLRKQLLIEETPNAE